MSTSLETIEYGDKAELRNELDNLIKLVIALGVRLEQAQNLSRQGLPVQLDNTLHGAGVIYQNLTNEINRLLGIGVKKQEPDEKTDEQLVNENNVSE